MSLALLLVVILAVVLVFGATLLTRGRRAVRREARRTAVPDAIVPSPVDQAQRAVSREAAPPETALPEVALPETARPGEVPAHAVAPAEEPDQGQPPRLRERLGRARQLLAGPLVAVRSRGRVDAGTFEELEDALILADVGVSTTTALLDAVRDKVRSGAVPSEAESVIEALKSEILQLFSGDDPRLSYGESAPSVWLFVGVNGVGKTTTIGKLAFRERALGKSVVLAAGDTFRAAAVEQLTTWAERSGAEIVRGSDGADPSSVVFDAIAHAAARRVDLVLADSAGRLHNKVNLMEELAKVRRVADRPPGHVTEVLLVLDATTGQNGLAQAREFSQTAGVTGIVLTKLDGTAKGGIVCSIRAELGVPIKLVGLGEGIADLVEFDPVEFATALLG